MAKLEKENLRLKTKQIKVNKKKEKEISRLKTKQIKEISSCTASKGGLIMEYL